MNDVAPQGDKSDAIWQHARSSWIDAHKNVDDHLKELSGLKRFHSWFRKRTFFSRRKSRSIVDRILGLILVWGFIIYVLAIAGIWLGSTRVIEDNFRYQAIEWVHKLDELGTPLYAASDADLFRSIRDHVSRFPELAYLRYYESDKNSVIADYQAESARTYDIPQLDKTQLEWLKLNVDAGEPLFLHTADNSYSLVQAAAPIVVRSIPQGDLLDFDMNEDQSESLKVIGYVEVGLDFSLYRRHLFKNLSIGSLIFAGLFVITAFFSRIIIKRALSPLVDLRTPLARLADGDTDVYVEGRGDEEVIAIANALNTTISALKNRDRKLRKLANYDSLTGLLNKHNFNLLLKEEFDRVNCEHDTSALLFIDLDQFKYINDTLGHAAGDRLLAEIADMLKHRMREDDVIARFGGDEFTVIARSVSEHDAEAIADSLVQSMQEFVFVENNQSFNVYCSIGVVMIGSREFSVEEIFSQADMACFQAKSKGRNRYHMFDAREREEIRKVVDMGWSKKIKEAIKYDSFELHYQPIVSLGNEDYEYYEVLLRLNQQGSELLYPNAFLPAADRLGVAVDVDYWVICNAFKKMSELEQQGRQVRLSINLSGRVFEAPDLVDRILGFADRYQVSPEGIIFEITEQTAVRQIERARQRIIELNKLGYRFALDDFGVGFSSFNYLKHLPVDYLKLDGGFIENMANDPVDQAMVQSMIQIARTLGKKTIAEYVLDAASLDLLQRFGIDYVQGFYLGRPQADAKPEAYQHALNRIHTNIVRLK